MAADPRSDPPKGTASDRATDLLIRGLIRLALALPLRARLSLMAGVTATVAAPVLGWRDRALANLRHVRPDMSGAEARKIADAAARNAGRTLIENYDPQGLVARMADIPLEGPGVPAIKAARANGQPVLFVTGHFGNYEAPRAALVARGYRVGGLYRPMKNPYFNAHYAANMHALSDPVFEQGRSGTMGLVRHLKAGGMAVLLFDVYTSDGAAIPFMGQPAPTALSAAEIAIRTGAMMIPFFGQRGPDGISLRAIFEAPVAIGTAEEMMREATARLEARIEENPGQWFWIHRRWKPKRQAKRQRKRAAAKMGP